MHAQTWYEKLDQLVYREGLSRPQIARRSGVAAKTIASWLRGDVRRPRRWQPIAQVLHALNASTEEANHILQLAGYRTVAEMIGSARDAEEEALLSGWLAPGAPYMAPNLPVMRLIGREYDMQNALRALLEKKRLAIWGMGGVGKTTLAIALALELKENYPHGVYWGEMRTSSAEAVLESWCQVCGVDSSHMTDFNSRAAHMRGLFSQQRALIVLDDVVDSQKAQQMIPSQLSDCAVIVTTRSTAVAQHLTHRDEQQIIALTPMLRRESRQLFAGVLGEEILQRDLEAVDRVAELLGDLPLALQIAAAICADTGLPLSKLAELLANLQDRLERLRQDQKPVVRLAFEQSWERMGDDLREALATLGVFEGRPFSIPAFAASAGIDETQGMFLLARLARLSLVTAVGDEWYRQHTLLAAYSLEKLGEKTAPWERCIAYYEGLLDRQDLDTQMLAVEGDSMAAAMGAAQRLGEWERVLHFSRRLQPMWRRMGAYVQSHAAAQWAEEAARKLGDRRAEAESDYYWGLSCLEQSLYGEARERLRMAREIFAEIEDPQGAGDAYYFLARTALGEDDFEGAETAVRRAWQAYQQAEDVRGMGRALYRLGHIYYNRGQYERAVELIDDALKTQSAGDDLRGWLRSLMMGLNASVQLRQFERAEAYRQLAANLVAQMDDAEQTTVYYYAYADLSRFQGQFPRAEEYGKKALQMFRHTGDVYSQANALNQLAGNELLWNEAEPDRQQFQAGLAYCREGLALCAKIEYAAAKGMLLLAEGRLLQQRGDIQEACASWRLSLEVADALGHEWLQKRLEGLINESACPPNDP